MVKATPSLTACILVRCFLRVAVLFVILKGATAIPLTGILGAAILEGREHGQHQHRDRRSVTDTACQLPTNIQSMFEDINTHVSAASFLRPAKTDLTINATNEVRLLVNDKENKTCPYTYSRVETASVSHRSICPFYFDILQLPQGYYPPTLQWAKCKCQQCIENTALSCEPVRTPLTVLKPNGCRQGMQTYVEQAIPGGVSTGCTCAFNGRIVGAGDMPSFSTASVPFFGQE